MDRIFFATILCNKEKVLSLYESNGSPITITHVIKLWKKLCQSVVVDMWKGQTSHVFLEVKFGGEFEIWWVLKLSTFVWKGHCNTIFEVKFEKGIRFKISPTKKEKWYVHNIFIINPKWQIVIVEAKK